MGPRGDNGAPRGPRRVERARMGPPPPVSWEPRTLATDGTAYVTLTEQRVMSDSGFEQRRYVVAAGPMGEMICETTFRELAFAVYAAWLVAEKREHLA